MKRPPKSKAGPPPPAMLPPSQGRSLRDVLSSDAAPASQLSPDAGATAFTDGLEPRLARYVGLAASIVALLHFLPTMSAGMHLGDGLELATAAHVVGVPHPTGYPLYMLVLKLWYVLTGWTHGEIIFRATLFNAIAMSGCAGLGTVILDHAFRRLFPAWTEKGRLLAAGSVALAGVMLRFHWENAVVAEVYALQFLLSLGIVRALQLAFDAAVEYRLEGAATAVLPARLSSATGPLLAATGLTGLGLAHHRMSIFFIAPVALAWGALISRKALARPLRDGLVALALLLAGLSLYAYLPIRAAAKPAINWGDPSSLRRFANHVRGGEYVHDRFLQARPGVPFTLQSWTVFATREAGQLLADFSRQAFGFEDQLAPAPEFGRYFFGATPVAAVASLALLALATLGGWRAFRASPWLASLLALAAAQHVGLLFLYNIADIRDYYLFPFWIGWVAASTGLLVIAGKARERAAAGPLAGVAPWTALLIPAIVASANKNRCNESWNRSAERMGAMVVPHDDAIVARDSLMITLADADAYTALYQQLVRHERPDMLVVGGNFLINGWYRAWYTPDQIARFHLEFSDGHQGTIQDFAALLGRVIEPNIAEGRAVYITDLDPGVCRLLNQRFPMKPVDSAPLENVGVEQVDTTTTLYRFKPREGAATTSSTVTNP